MIAMSKRATARNTQIVTREPRPNAALASSIVGRLKPYDAVAIRPNAGDFFKLDWNEATVSPSPRVADAIKAHLDEVGGLHWYPALYDRELAGDLSAFCGVPASNILVTAGSDAALQLICDTFIEEDTVVAVPEPTYAHFVLFAKGRGGDVMPIVPENPFEPHMDDLLDALRLRPRVLYLVNPNNPTGVTYTPEQIETLLDAGRHTLIIVDEAYIEFGGESVASLVMKHPNLVVTRTFSKAFGLAAMRVGYVCAGDEALASLKVLYNPKSVGTLALVAARAAVQDRESLAWYVNEVREAREILAQWFQDRGHEVFYGNGNFILIRASHQDASGTVATLKSAGIFVRDRSSQAGLAGCFRVSIGTVEQTRVLIERLEQIGV